jgi:NAD(P)-dependent dehydrogenase (short-subunit alcohol dehydrogenase family)
MIELDPTQPLKGRLALVTGASRGIGYAVALGLAKAGAHVIALARTQGGLEALDDEIFAATGERATLVPGDVTDGDALDRLGAAIYERWGKLDILVANAGEPGVVTPLAHMDPKVFDKAVAVNLTANFRLIRSLDPLLRKAEAPRALFVTSRIGEAPRAFFGAYAASKAGLDALITTYADEMEKYNLRAVLVDPGPMRTKMRAAAFPGENPETLTPPEAIVPMIVELARPDLTPPARAVFKEWRARQG